MKNIKTNLLRNSVKVIILITTLFITSCKDDTVSEKIVEGTEIIDISFLKVNNPSLLNDVYLDQDGTSFTGRVPFTADIKNLVASYIHNGAEVQVNGVVHQVGVASNDYSKPVTFTVKTTDGGSQDYLVDVTYFTGLPMVYIYTEGNVPIVSKEDEVDGTFLIDGGRNFDLMEASEMEIRGRGNSTWYLHPKKPYQMKLSDKAEVLGMPKDKKWIFLAEYSDKTLMRNKIAFEMGYLSKLEWTPKSEYAEVFVNNEYSGTYNISQKVEESSNRVNLGDTGYLLEIDQL